MKKGQKQALVIALVMLTGGITYLIVKSRMDAKKKKDEEAAIIEVVNKEIAETVAVAVK